MIRTRVIGVLGLVCVSTLLVAASGCSKKVEGRPPVGTEADPQVQQSPSPSPSVSPSPEPAFVRVLAPNERLISFLQTNDLHGSLEPNLRKDGSKIGGMELLSGAIGSVRRGLERQFGEQAGVLLVDGGDQFQGSLLSNFDEGQTLFAAMNQIGYDAVVPGNHDYDFGPIGWLEDKVKPTSADTNPRGSLLRLIQQVSFPLLSANTYYKASFKDWSGNAVQVSSFGCAIPSSAEPDAPNLAPELRQIDWSQTVRPEFLKPYLIREVAGVRVALIGIDNPRTPEITTPQNVSDLCFDDEAESYLRVRSELEGKADIFVMLMHNVRIEPEFIAKINASGRNLDLILAGHTHQVTKEVVGGVPIIQSGSNARMFGRADLVWDVEKKQVVSKKTAYTAGVQVFEAECDGPAKAFCKVENGKAVYEGVELTPSAEIAALIQAAKTGIASVAGRKLGTVVGDKPITVHRLFESPLANALTDALREVTQVEIAFLNTGGIRTDLPPGDFTYDQFFRVMPFNNVAVVLDPLPRDKLLKLLLRSAQTCGDYGALMSSGLRVTFERDCKKPENAGKADPNAKLLKVATLAGQVVFDASVPELSQIEQGPAMSFRVATLDFLASGGGGYEYFVGTPMVEEIDILRELLTRHWLAKPASFTLKTDGRWNDRAQPAPGPSASSSPAPAPVPAPMPSLAPSPTP